MLTKNLSHKKSFFKTIFVSFIVISLFTTLTLTTALSLNYIKSSVEIVNKYSEKLLLQTNYIIDEMNQQINHITDFLLNDIHVTSFFSEENQDVLSTIFKNCTFDKQFATLPYLDSIYLFNASTSTIYSSKTGKIQTFTDFSDKNAVELITKHEFISSDHPISVVGRVSSDFGPTISYFLYDSPSGENEQRNAIVVNVLPSFLETSINSINQFSDETDTSFLIIDEEGTILCSVLSPSLSALPNLSNNMKTLRSDDSPFVKIGKIQYIKSSTMDNHNNWSLISLVPLESFFHDIWLSAIIGVSIMIIVLVICFLVCLYLTRKLNSPIQAITDIVLGNNNESTDVLQKTKEFDTILSAFETLQEQNSQFERMKQKIVHSSRKNFLNLLISNSNLPLQNQEPKDFYSMDLAYLLEDSLCMIIFKMDNYRSFYEKNSTNELWALRFAIINILEDVFSEHFTSDVLNRENDRFIVLVDCKENCASKEFICDLEKIITKAQANVKHYLKLTLTAAYSPFFHGSNHLYQIACNLEDSLLMKMKYGHEAIISPHKVDEMNSDTYQFPTSQVEELISLIHDGNCDTAAVTCQQIMNQFFCYNYDEIFSGMIHLLYNIYLGVQNKYPHLKENCTLLLKEYLSRLQGAEIADDLSNLMEEFIRKICQITAIQSSSIVSDNAIVNRIIQIIEREYSNPSLCLSFIAEEVGLTPNYIGKLFKANTQKSVSQFILDYRMDTLAKYLNESKLPLNEILDKVGIEKTNYFYTQFKKHFGISLMEYRSRQDS